MSDRGKSWPRWIPLDDTARGLARFQWLERELPKSTWPTLLIWGREDATGPVAPISATG